MRVLQVNDYREGGGCEVLVEQTMAALRARGIEVERLTADDVPGHRRTPLSYIDSPRCRRALRRRLDTFRPDVVHLHNVYHELSPGVLATLARWRRGRGVRVVMTAHDFHLVCPNAGMRYARGGTMHLADPAQVHRLGYVLRRRWDHRGRAHAALKLAQHLWNYRLHRRRRAIDLVLCPSRFMQRAMEGAGLPTAYLPHPAPDLPSVARPARPEVREGSHAPGDLRFVFVGRIEPEKGLRELFEHWPADLNATFAVVGEGSQRRACEELVHRRGLGDRVSFRGRLPHDAVVREVAAAHVLVLPSLCYESAGLVLLEALTLGTNVLVSDLGAPSQLVEETGIGFRFRPGPADDLARSLRAIRAAHQRGELNAFDVAALRRQRSLRLHIDRLLRVYHTGCTGEVDAAADEPLAAVAV